MSIKAKLKRICSSVELNPSNKMIVKVVFLLVISSVVIASEKSCDNVGNVTAQNAKYLKFNGGFFYM